MSVKQVLTAEDLWTMPEVPGKRFELVDGELVEMPGTSGIHGLIALAVAILLRGYVRAHDLGFVWVDGTAFIIARDPDVVRVPDVAFVARNRVPAVDVRAGFVPFAPDLAVEIVSPNDRPGEVQTKIGEYLGAGSRAVWVILP